MTADSERKSSFHWKDFISRLIFHPPNPATYSDRPGYVWLETSRGEKISSYFINENSNTTLLFSHGNAEDIGTIAYQLEEIASTLHVNVFTYDYTGYGLNNSKPSEQDCYADIRAAYSYLINILKIPSSQIILYGRSLGTAVTCHLAWEETKRHIKLGGLILQSPLMSIYRIDAVANLRFTIWGDAFCSIDKIGMIESPIFVIHGTMDEVVPVHHGQELYLAIKTEFRYKPLWIKGAGHNNIEYYTKENGRFLSALSEFVNSTKC